MTIGRSPFQDFITQLDGFIKLEIAKRLKVAGIVGNTIAADSIQGAMTAGLVSLPQSGSQVLVAAEGIADSELVHFDAAGTVSLADASLQKPANGFVLDAITSGQNGRIYTVGLIPGLSSLTIGALYYLSTAGTITATAPTATGAFFQIVGRAISATQLSFTPQPPIIL